MVERSAKLLILLRNFYFFQVYLYQYLIGIIRGTAQNYLGITSNYIKQHFVG
jgi:hypothetical protein